MKALLEAGGLAISFGGLKAVQDFNLHLPPNVVQGLIGPNGAGKTTVFNLLTGVYRPTAGGVHLAGQRLDGQRPSRIAAAGLARTFQNIRLFPDLTVLDNVRVACHLRTRVGLWGVLTRAAGQVGQERAILERSLDLLRIFHLEDRRDELARNLPYGDQRRLEIARALATNPKVLLLDEPAAGMNTNEKLALRELIRDLRKRFEIAILMIEHDMAVVMDVCERITVLDYGQTIAVGTPAEIQSNRKVIEAYLGTPQELPAAAKV